MVGLYTAGCPLHIDEEGIEKIVEYCEKHPGLLILLDSYAKCVQGLGLDERSADIADPLSDLQEAIAPYEATLVVIHHANKQSHGQSASMASRGSTALPAAVSQIVSMARVSSEEQSPIARRDNRIKLMTEEPLELLIEQVEGGNSWCLHGTAEQIRQTEGFKEVIEKLTDRQDEVLSDMCNHWMATGKGMDARHLENALNLKRQAARKIMQALKSKGLILEWGQSDSSSAGRPRILFRPVEEVLGYYRT
jgi:predicted transcriptional regulator